MDKQGDSWQVAQSNRLFFGESLASLGIALQERPGPLDKSLKESNEKGQIPGNSIHRNCE